MAVPGDRPAADGVLGRRCPESVTAPAAALLAFAYAFALRSDTSFEEASAAQAEERAQRRTAPRALRKAGPAPFTLALEGRPNLPFSGRTC